MTKLRYIFIVQTLLIWPTWKNDIFIVIFKGMFVAIMGNYSRRRLRNFMFSVILYWAKMKVKADNISNPVPYSGCLLDIMFVFLIVPIQFRQDLWLVIFTPQIAALLLRIFLNARLKRHWPIFITTYPTHSSKTAYVNSARPSAQRDQ